MAFVERSVPVVSLLCFGFVTAKLSDYTTPCPLGVPDMNECIKDSAHKMIQATLKGISEYGIPITDPLFVPSFRIEQGLSSGGIALDMTNVTIRGVRTMVLQSVSADPSKYLIEAKATMDELHFQGNYVISGKIMFLPISGTGNCNIQMLENDVIIRMRGKPTQKNGKTYMKITDFKFEAAPKKGSCNFENLFNGNKRLGDVMNTVLNENFLDLYSELKPSVGKVLGGIFRGLSERIFNKAPYSEIFPQ